MAKRFIISRDEKGSQKAVNSWSVHREIGLIEKHYHEKLGFKFYQMLKWEKVIDGIARLPEDTEAVFLYISEHDYDLAKVANLFKHIPNAKIIWQVAADKRLWGGVKGQFMKEHFRPFLKRVNVILDNQVKSWRTKEAFCVEWPEYAHKHVFFPQSFYPEEEYDSLSWQEKPIIKCLFSGKVGDRYDLRNYLIGELAENKSLQEVVDLLRHPEDTDRRKALVLSHRKEKIWEDYYKIPSVNKQYGNEIELVVRAAFAKVLNKYFASICVNGGRRVQIVMCKYLEIPAAGSLLIAERFHDLDLTGLVPYKHYVPVEADYLETDDGERYVRSNIALVIKSVIQYWQDYQHIRKAGMEYVRKHHGIKNRLKEIDSILERLLAGETRFRNYGRIEGEK